MGGWMCGWMDVWVDGCVGGWMCGWMDVWVDGWLDRWTDGWMDGHVPELKWNGFRYAGVFRNMFRIISLIGKAGEQAVYWGL